MNEEQPKAPRTLLTDRTQLVFWASISLALLLALALFLLVYYQQAVCEGLTDCYQVFTDRHRIKGFLKRMGPWAPVLFIAIQTLQVVLAPIPGEATGFIGGYLFGVPLGMLYSTLGLTFGSLLAFSLGRWLEHRFVERVVNRDTLERFDFLMERQGALIAFFLFVVPGFPKDYLCFILGLSLMSWKLFLLLSTVGRLPGTLMLTLQGAQVYKGNYLFTAVLVVFCLALAGTMYYYREPLYHWLRRWDHSPARERETPGGEPG